VLYRPEGLGATSAELTRSATCVGEDHQTAWPGPPRPFCLRQDEPRLFVTCCLFPRRVGHTACEVPPQQDD